MVRFSFVYDFYEIFAFQVHVSNKHRPDEVANGLFERRWWDFIANFKKASLLNFISLAVSPDILDEPTSQDIIVQEYENVTLSCTATGSPGLCRILKKLRLRKTWPA